MYGATLFLSAALLFGVEPMFSKMVLPLLGGSAAVWTTCMLFFQAVLLLGYGYAHGVARLVSPRAQVALQLVLVGIALTLVPVGVPAGWVPPVEGAPTLWLLALLTVSLGVPFFVLATMAPLLQRWFDGASSGGGDPYPLYAASNLGSLVTLLSYPFVVEPLLSLQRQRALWADGYWLLAMAVTVCALTVWKARPATGDRAVPKARAPITMRTRLGWVLYAFVPSSLLLGVTNYISTDIAAAPFLWVIPLALYLLTFVLVFARGAPERHTWMLWIQPFAIIPLMFIWSWGIGGTPTVLMVLHLAAFFSTAMVCHGELARRRPSPDGLTDFYLMLALGGVLGGIFNAVLAPHLFHSVVEYPLVLALACFLRPKGRKGETAKRQETPVALSSFRPFALELAWGLLPALLMAALAPVARGLVRETTIGPMLPIVAVAIASACVAALCYAWKDRPLRFGASVAGVLTAAAVPSAGGPKLLHAERSFFGVHRVREDPTGKYHTLYHGVTLHGAQAVAPERRCDPLTYYSREGPAGAAMEALAPAHGRRVAVVGLGSGTLAAYAKPGESWTYYEIDPVVERIARDPRYFTYLTCAPGLRVVLGDARLSLTRAPDRSYDLLVLDAFSSDGIPVHLLTREAIAMYRAKLRPGGAILLHLSNRHLDLAPVVAAEARDAGLAGRIGFWSLTPAEEADFKAAGLWAVLAGREGDLGALANDPRWRPLLAGNASRLWTDDYSDLVRALTW
jgi:SAM-dependent methyltransferase